MMYAVTAKAEFVKREIERVEGAGLKLDVVDIPELSLRNVATLLEIGRARRRAPVLERTTQHAAARAPGRAVPRSPRRDRCRDAGRGRRAQTRARRRARARGAALARLFREPLRADLDSAAARERARERRTASRSRASSVIAVREVDLQHVVRDATMRCRRNCSGCACRRSAPRCAPTRSRCSAMYQQINLYQPIFRKQRQIFSAVTMLQALGDRRRRAAGRVRLRPWPRSANLEAEVVQLEGREKALTTQLARIDPSLSANRRDEVEQELRRLERDAARSTAAHRSAARRGRSATRTGFSAYLAALGAPAHAGAVAHAASRSTAAPARSSSRGAARGPSSCRSTCSGSAASPCSRANSSTGSRSSATTRTGESTFRATSRAVALTLADNGERRQP